MKKIFAQPEMMVVNVVKNDIITNSVPRDTSEGNMLNTNEILAPGQRGLDDWYEGY